MTASGSSIPAPLSTGPQRPLAIIGMSCRFPGAHDTESFWNLAHSGSTAIADLPPDRLDRSLYFGTGAGRSYSALGGVVPATSNGSLCRNPGQYDPAHQLLLEVAAEACADAGWDPQSPPYSNVGVYVGHARTSPLPGDMVYATHIEECVGILDAVPEFQRLEASIRRAVKDGIVQETRKAKPHRGQSGEPFVAPGVAATLLSQTFGLNGPSMIIDAACASSLIALSIAAGALRQGKIDAAIVGGASFSNWESMVLFSRAQALSAAGSFPFDERAAGFVSSDGYSALVLKTLERAEADGDRILAVIRGIGVSSDGRGKSLWAPRKEGQIEAIRRASAGLRIDYVEAHGTSTQLGDATEIQSLAATLGTRAEKPIPIGSVKANIGHTCESAGLAGVIKTVLALRHHTIPPTAGLATPNSRIDWRSLPFFAPTEPLPWPEPSDGGPRRAAVDAFGIGGLNAQVIVEEHGAPERAGVREPLNSGAIAVIGAGAIFPGARNLEGFWQLLASKRDPKTRVPAERWDAGIYHSKAGGVWRSPACRGGFITDFEYDWRRHRVPPKQVETADPLQFMLLDAADQALDDSGYCQGKTFDRRRTAVVVGTMFNGDFGRQLTVALHYPEFERELERELAARGARPEQTRKILQSARKKFHERWPMLSDDTGSYTASTLASRIARTLDLMGGAFAVDAGDGSSGAALEAAADMLRSRACDLALCAAGQRSMDITLYEELGLRGLLGEDGLLPGEGAGVVVLKRLEDARRDGDRIRAIIGDIRPDSNPPIPDDVARQVGHSMGAAGMAALLGAIAPGETGPATVSHGTLLGQSYRMEIERPAPPARRRVAFLFAGQGSQHHGMLQELVRESPAARAKMREADETMARLGYPSFAEIAWNGQSGLGTDIWLTQVSVLLADTIAFAAAKEQGLAPDVVAGHSYGELAALVAAGAWTLEQAIVATRARAESIRPGGTLIATDAPAEVIEKLAAGSPVHIAIRNAPGQIIAGGEIAAIEAVRDKLAAAGFSGMILPVPAAFHTPLLAGAGETFGRALEQASLFPPAIPVLSGVTNRYVAEPSDIRRNLAAQLSTPMDYPAMIRRLADEGVSTFVEIGPKQTLTRLNERILNGAGAQSIAIDDPKRRRPLAHFDATERRRQKNQQKAAAPAQAEKGTAESSLSGDELTASLENLICERTGYPRDLVTPEADLEADLGLDSIARVQLALELAERFELGDIRDQRIQDFRTVRDIRQFLADSKKKRPSVAGPAALRILRLSGTPYEMGLEHGRQRSSEIRSLVERYIELLGGKAEERKDLKSAMANAEAYFGASGLEELRGLAEGCDLPLPFVAGYNLALNPEFLAGCSHFVTRTDTGLLHGMNEDAPLSLRLPVGPPAVMARRPEHGLAHVSFGLAGQFAGINGMNEAGLVVSSASLLDQAAPSLDSPGRMHCALVKEILEQAEGVDRALEIARTTRHTGAWSLLLSHAASGRVCYVEYADEKIAVREVERTFAGANHSLLLNPTGEVPSHSLHRLQRLSELTSADSTAASARASLRDQHDGERNRNTKHATMNTVRRVDNLMSVLIEPGHGEAWVNSGGEAEDYKRLDIPDLLDGATMRRWVLRTVEAPIAVGPFAFQGPAFVAGEGRRADALRAALGEAGCTISQTAGAEVRHLFLATDDVMAAHELCKSWVAALHLQGRLEGATLAGITSLGGDFGLSGHIESVRSGGLAGLLKAIRREFSALNVKIVDAPADEPPEALAQALLSELGARGRETETGRLAGRRSVLRLLRRRAPAREVSPVSHGGVWVVTGGAKGITAFAARELGARYGLKLHLLGRSAEASVEFPATYHRCDITDDRALAETLNRIRQADGPIRGVLHGAGVEISAPLPRKNPCDVAITVAAKVTGAVHLMELTAGDPLEAFVAFGSVSGRFGGHGQSDYSMASEWLAKLIQEYRADRPACASVIFHWPAWDEIGMSIRPASRAALDAARQRLMPPAEGVAWIIDELEAGAPEGEVVILDSQGILDTDGIMRRDLPGTRGMPLLDGFLEAEDGRSVVEIRFDPPTNQMLRDHRFQGEPLLPGAMSAEVLAEAASAACSGPRITALRGLEFRHRLAFPGDRAGLAHVKLAGAECRLTSEFRNRAGIVVDPARIVACATTECSEPGAPPSITEPGDLDWLPMQYPDQGPVIHGPSLRVLEELAISGSGGYGRIRPTEATGILPVAALDGCLVACGAYALKSLGLYALPRRFEALRWWRLPRPDERCLVHFALRGREDSTVRFDFTLAGEGGKAILQAEGYEAAVIGEDA
jgi:acyl transferase domain-containing protein/acyl carrier protein